MIDSATMEGITDPVAAENGIRGHAVRGELDRQVPGHHHLGHRLLNRRHWPTGFSRSLSRHTRRHTRHAPARPGDQRPSPDAPDESAGRRPAAAARTYRQQRARPDGQRSSAAAAALPAAPPSPAAPARRPPLAHPVCRRSVPDALALRPPVKYSVRRRQPAAARQAGQVERPSVPDVQGARLPRSKPARRRRPVAARQADLAAQLPSRDVQGEPGGRRPPPDARTCRQRQVRPATQSPSLDAQAGRVLSRLPVAACRWPRAPARQARPGCRRPSRDVQAPTSPGAA